MVRIGNTILNTDIMSADEIDILAEELRNIAMRKRRAEVLLRRFTKLVEEARQEGFEFIEEDFHNVLTSDKWGIIDTQ